MQSPSRQQQSLFCENLYSKGIKLILNNQIASAQSVYKELIKVSVKEFNHKFFGLGSCEDQQGYCRTRLIKWFCQNFINRKKYCSPHDCLSLCYSILKNYEDGRLWYEQMIQKFPTNFELYYGLANIYHNEHEYDLAENYYQKVIELSPMCHKAYQQIAFINIYSRQDKKKAKLYISLALNIWPEDMHSQFLSIAIEQDGQQKILKLNQLYRKFPQYLRIKNSIGKVYLMLENYEEALVNFYQCLKIDCLYAVPNFNIALVYKQMGNIQKSISFLEECLSKDKTLHYCYTFLGKLYYNYLNNFQKAISILTESLNYKNSRLSSCFQLGKIYNKRKQYDQSIRWFEECIKLNPRNSVFYSALGIVYENKKDYSKAVTNHERCIEINPQNIDSRSGLADAYFELQNIEKACENYEKCFKLQGEVKFNYKNYYKLSIIYYQQGLLALSAEFLNKAVKYNPSKSFLYISLGEAYLNLKQFDKAGQAYQAAAQKLKMNEDLYEQDIEDNQVHAALAEYYGNDQNWSVKKHFGYIPKSKFISIKISQEQFRQRMTKMYQQFGSSSLKL